MFPWVNRSVGRLCAGKIHPWRLRRALASHGQTTESGGLRMEETVAQGQAGVWFNL
jgi:hypothetical protein